MGQRCNLVITTGTTYELYYSHWRANTLDADLFWGPDPALAFVRRQRSVAEGAAWLDTGWAEGGAVIDPDRRRLCWWGGDVVCDVDLRRLLLARMAQTWAGWEVRWASRGIFDLAEYVGEPSSTVRGPEPEAREPRLEPPDQPDWVDCVLSVRHADGRLRFFQLAHSVRDQLWDCAGVVHGAEKLGGVASCDLRSLREPLQGGAHLDVASRTATWWSARHEPWSELLASRNEGWTMNWVQDRYEVHPALAGPQLVLPDPALRDLEGTLRSILLRPETDHSDVVPALVAARPGHTVEVNPFALRDDPPTLTVEERTRRWELLSRG
jgi:hypothetical protein